MEVEAIGNRHCLLSRWNSKGFGYRAPRLPPFMESIMQARCLSLFAKQRVVEWEYEPKRFKLKDGVRYTPDFYLKEQDLWIDVKGQLTEKHKMKHKLFKELGCNFKLVFIKEIQERLGYSYHIFKKQWDVKVESDNVEIPRRVVASTK